DIEYHISTDTSGISIPLLFYAMDLYSAKGVLLNNDNMEQDFMASIDGVLVEISPIPHELQSYDSSMSLADFEYYFYHENDEYEGLFEMNDSETSSFYVSPSDLKYFETNIDSGKHIIKASYYASTWTYQDIWVQEKSFRYALSPAQYWKSFNELNITIDASNYNGEVQFTSQDSTSFTGIMNHQYLNIPYDVIVIEQVIDINPFAQTLINLSPFNIAIITLLILLIIHTFLQYRYRKTNTIKLFSWIALIGGLLVPILTILVFWSSYELIYMLLGNMASNRASYGMVFAIFILGPILFMVYLLYSFLIDFIFKRNLKN
ncbi:MAG: hypothetical protein ACPG4Z_04895, partial [Chitinophagales bacterium]